MRLVEDASGRRLYVCLRCGNKFWSRAKKPQCSVCRSKRVIPYEEFLQLPQEEQERILGRQEEKKAERVEVTKVKEGEAEGNSVKIEESPEGERGKSEDSPGENGGKSGKTGESPKIPLVKKGEKQGEVVKGERVKRGISIPRPRLSWKAWSIIIGVAFIYYLYKVGWFDEMFRQVKRLTGKEEPVKAYGEERRSPVLGKIESNLRG
ncbi:hypothetical protein [Thermococcus nautili]|uniref:hypothetical protein n=1 Tax=Thermococcus nautili TaxID=195522 RepID=UPI0025522E54|nr:hypothetical protein [Thermococcus nautili]